MYLLVLTSIFALSVACNPQGPQVDSVPDIMIDPLRCQSAGEGCDMKWNISKSNKDFPANLEILVNDKTIFNECDRDVNVSVNRTGGTIEISILHFFRLSGTEKFKLKLNDLKDCYSSKTDFYSSSVQSYEVKKINGDDEVFIKL